MDARSRSSSLAAAAVAVVGLTACGSGAPHTASVSARSARPATGPRGQVATAPGAGRAQTTDHAQTAAAVPPNAPATPLPTPTAQPQPSPTPTPSHTATAPAVSGSPQATGTPSPSACGSVVFAPQSSYLASGIEVSGSDCATAVAVASASRPHQYDPPPAGSSVQSFSADGFTCNGQLDAHSVLELTDYRCKRGSAVVTFQRSA
jgi:hypothetical protein